MSIKFLKLFTINLLILLLLTYFVNTSDNSTDYDTDDGDNSENGNEESNEYTTEDNVKSNDEENLKNNEEDSLKNTNLNNETISGKSYNASDDYDYSEGSVEEEEKECDTQTFIDKVRQIHEEGRNETIKKNVKHINETFDALKKVRNVFGNLFGIDEREKLKIYEFLSDIDLKLSPDCLSSYFRIFSAIGEADLWALKFVDSLGSFPPKGFAEGVLADFGEYDECLDIKSPNDKNNRGIIKGQYCMMRVILPFPAKNSISKGDDFGQSSGLASKYQDDLKLEQFTIKSMIESLNIVNGTIYRFGVCIPSSCRPKEVENVLNQIFQPIIRLPVEIDEECHMKDDPIILDNYQLISLSILSVLILIVISSTVFDIYQNRKELEFPETQISLKPTKAQQFLLSFSAIKNTRSLFAKSPEKWAALDTIRLLLIVNVHIVHTYIITTTLGLVTLKKIFSILIPRMFHDSRYFFARNGLMIDVLYNLSGFLISYGLLRKLEQSKGRFNYFAFIFQQWVRFTILGFGSLIFFYLFPLFGEGPIWDYGIVYITHGCKNPFNLFRIFFFFNNFHEFTFETFHETCNLPIWFLSALLQFLVVSPFFIILYYRNRKLGTYAISAAIALSSFATVMPYYFLGIKPYLQVLIHGAKLLSQNVTDSINWYHTYPNVQAISYFTGIAAGFVMKNNVKISKKRVKVYWILSVIGIVLTYVWYDSFWKPGDKERAAGAILFHTVGKFMFNVCWSWVFLACCTGRGGFVNAILSWRVFQPIARLSFGMFLLHFLVINRRIFSTKETLYPEDSYIWQCIIIDLMVDVILAYFFYLILEGPFSNIFKIIYARKPSEKPTELPIEKVVNNLNIRLDT